MAWHETIRIEVKTTTRESVPLPLRELESLAAKADNEVGILAALFWCGDRSVDGRWLIADAEDSFRNSDAQSTSVSKSHMQRAHRGQSWLSELKEHVEASWPAFLQGFLTDAMQGHETLCEVLQDCHEHGTVVARMPAERILETDHRDSVERIIERFGESQAGHIFQDLFAYLVALAGYTDVLLNPVGVPDVTVSGFRAHGSDESSIDLGRFGAEDARKLLRYCEQAGDDHLAGLIRSRFSGERRHNLPGKPDPD